MIRLADRLARTSWCSGTCGRGDDIVGAGLEVVEVVEAVLVRRRHKRTLTGALRVTPFDGLIAQQRQVRVQDRLTGGVGDTTDDALSRWLIRRRARAPGTLDRTGGRQVIATALSNEAMAILTGR